MKNWLIKKLGGLTKNEMEDVFSAGFKCGNLASVDIIIAHCNKINGLDADSWCKDVYSFLEKVRANRQQVVKDLFKSKEEDYESEEGAQDNDN